MLRKATNFFINLLIQSEIKKNFNITLFFTKNLKKKHDAVAHCWVYVERRHRTFLIEVDPILSKEKIIRSIAHECVHIKQYAMDELHETKEKEKPRFLNKIFDEKEINYWDLPWEIEAYGREEGLYRRFLEQLKKDKEVF